MFLIIIRGASRREEIFNGDGWHTIDCNGHALGQLIAVCSYERGDLPELVELKILEIGLLSVNNDFLEVELIRLGDSFYGNGAWGMLT